MKKTFWIYFVLGGWIALALSKAFAADITPPSSSGYPFSNGQTINASQLNSALAGTINSTFYTGKGARSALNSADVFLSWSAADGVFYQNAASLFTANTNIIASQGTYTSGISNSFQLLVLDNAGAILGKTTISNLLYYGINQAQLLIDPTGLLYIRNTAQVTNTVLWNPTVSNTTFAGTSAGTISSVTLAGAVLTNCITSNSFTVYAANTNSSGLFFYDPAMTTGNHAWQMHMGSLSNFSIGLAQDDFSAFQNAIVIGRNGFTPTGVSFPFGVTVGVGGNSVAQVNTYTSSTNNPFAAATLLTFAHGMAVRPTSFNAVFVCVTGQNNWVAGDEIPFSCTSGNANVPPANVWADTSNVYVRINNNNASTLFLLDKNTGVQAGMTTNNFKVRVYATYVY